MFNKKSKELDKSRDKLTKQLERMKMQAADSVESYQWLDGIDWDALDKDTLREVLERIIERIVIRDKDIEIYFK